MSSSRQSSNNNNNNNQNQSNQFLNYETNEALNTQSSSQQSHPRGQPSHESHFYQQMYPYQEDMNGNLANELVDEFDTKDNFRPNLHDEDTSVFSDTVQDAFKKYQNEYSKYWTYNDVIWDNKVSDDEQEELYAQMEECWNYMSEENECSDSSKVSTDQNQESRLNPDANEFKPSWLKTSSNEINQTSSNTLPSSNQTDKQEKQL